MITEEEFLALPVGTVLEGWAPDDLLIAFGVEDAPAVHEITFEKQHDGTWNTTYRAPWVFLAPDEESGNGITDDEFVALGFGISVLELRGDGWYVIEDDKTPMFVGFGPFTTAQLQHEYDIGDWFSLVVEDEEENSDEVAA